MDSKSQIRPRSYFLGATALVVGGLVIGLGLSAGLNLQRPSTATSAGDTRLAASSPAAAALPESPFVSLVERALPAVVFIDVQKKSSSGNEDPNDEFMKRFFGDMGRRQQRVPSSGSGFIIDTKGYVLTNNHVVRDADVINVTLNDQRRFKARIVGVDPQTDVAVIKIDAPNLPVLPLGDSDRLRVGDWAIAIGNPLGELRGSVTVGIVSAQGRSNLNIFGNNDLAYQDFIQTDASINFGNSGGPLVNIRGEAIGINTAINTSGQGIGFAIPINLAKHVSEQLIANGTVKRSMLGVFLAELTPEIAEGFGIAGQQGVLIQRIVPGSPAEKSGLKRNDVIVEYQGQQVSDMQKLRFKVADTPPGSRVNLVVLRDGKRVPVSLTLQARDEEALAGRAESTNPTPEEIETAGLTVRRLTSEERDQLKVESGVKITAVETGSIADDNGLQPNDVVEQINRQPVDDPATFARVLSEVKKANKPAVFIVNRGGATQYVTMRMDK